MDDMSKHEDATIAESGLPSTTATATEWSVGKRVLDQYDIAAVHRGGMGVIYRARHLGWGTDVAVKCPRPELFRNFGLAGAYTLPGGTAGAYRGTRHYASPEQAAGDGLGTGSDVWSLSANSTTTPAQYPPSMWPPMDNTS